MEAIQEWLSWLGDILFGLWENVTNIGNWITGSVEKIKFAINIPMTALDTTNKLVEYFPVYLWAPILSIISLVITFRLLKIILSGG